MIRPATVPDIADILVLGEKFFNEAGWPEVTEWNEQSVVATLSGLIDGKIDGGLLVAEYEGQVVGMAGFMCFPFYFNVNHRAAQEIFWYVAEEHRFGAGRLLMDALEDAARERGARVFIMATVDKLRSDALARLYRRRGYRTGETTFMKRLVA